MPKQANCRCHLQQAEADCKYSYRLAEHRNQTRNEAALENGREACGCVPQKTEYPKHKKTGDDVQGRDDFSVIGHSATLLAYWRSEPFTNASVLSKKLIKFEHRICVF